MRKSIDEARWLWLTLAAVLFVFCWMHVTITSQVDMSRFETLLNNLPEAWEKFSPVPFKKLISYPARIAVTYEEPMLYLLMTIWCIARSSDSVSGELGRGTMEMMLAQPVSRLQVLITSIFVTICGIALLASVAWAGTCVGIATTTVERPPPGASWSLPFWQNSSADTLQQIPMRQLAGFGMFIPAALNYFSLGYFLAGSCTFLSSCDRYRWRTIGLMMGFYVVQMLTEILGQAFEKISWVRQLSIFAPMNP